ncbi:MAG TPA: nuclear transport factor 2 family protein [Pyrinomonadaceae bacterium]
MKKALAFAALILLAACTAPSTNRESTNSNATAAKPAAAPLTEAEAIAKEKQVWEVIEKKDYNAFAEMIDEQALSVSNEVVEDKAATVKGVSTFVPADVVLSDWKFLPIDKDAAVIVYKANYKATVNGQPIPPQSVYASTAWVNRNGKWLAIYHQESEILKTPPAPPAARPEKTAPSPATSGTPATLSSDVTANEKLVWDALRTKNYDAFATFLSPDSIEVEPYGITDKAGSVKGVQGYDLSKTELSDWKTVRFDDDASLVSYVTRYPGQTPERERHTTIWANRGGKWLAVFHQGSQIVPAPAASPTASK